MIDINKNKDKRERIKLILDDALETPSTKTLFKIISTRHHIIKLFLFVFLSAFTGYSSYLVINSIFDYLNYGVTTTSRTFYETSTLFPKVTFCNLNSFTTKYAWNLTETSIDDGMYLSDEEKKKLGHDLKDILFECKFNLERCDSSNFTWSFDPWHGNCFTFNSDLDSSGNETTFKQSTMTGPLYGLRFTFYVNYYEKFMDSATYNMLGALIRIGNSSFSTYYPALSGILVPPGFQANIAVEREFKSILPKPYSNCEIDSNSPKFIQNLDLYNLIVESKYEYTQQLCFYQCYQRYLIQKYNCTEKAFLSLFNESFCLAGVVENDNFVTNFIDKNCISSCPLECDKLFYKTSSSLSQITANSYALDIQYNPNLASDFIDRTLDLSTVRESFVKVNIFYESLSYSLTTESAQWDANSLLGSIGGNLGLFLGMSVFSFSELIVLGIEIFFVLYE
jgi:hypothetical protein